MQVMWTCVRQLKKFYKLASCVQKNENESGKLNKACVIGGGERV